MRFRLKSTDPVKIKLPLAPVVSVAFLLLMFYLVNLRILAPEGRVHENLPIDAPIVLSDDRAHREIKVGLRSDRDGHLTEVTIDSKSLGNGDAAFERLNREILRIIGRPGNPLTRDIEVEIDADFETQYKYVVRAISHCTGHYDPNSRQIARYIEKIKFAPPHKPKL